MYTHCTMADLLAIRDGEGTASARQHLEECAECREELEQLHQRVAALKALPTRQPPRDRWTVIREEVLAGRRRQRWALTGWASLAVAASLAVLVGLRAVAPRSDLQARPVASLDSLVRQSQQLEEALRTLDPTSRVLSGRAASAIASLEDRIAAVDARLADANGRRAPAEDVVNLWRQRVELMNALVNVHVTRAAYVGL